MLCKSPFESFTYLKSIVHITIFLYKGTQKKCIKTCYWFQIFCTKKNASACSLGKLDEKKSCQFFLKGWNSKKLAREGTLFLCHLANCLYSLSL